MPETSVHMRDKNREISPLEREEGYGGKDLEKRWVLRREWKTLWDTPTLRVPPFRVTQGHRNRQRSIGYLWLPINVP